MKFSPWTYRLAFLTLSWASAWAQPTTGAWKEVGPAPELPGRLVWVCDPTGPNLAQGQLQMFAGGRWWVHEGYPAAAFPAWSAGGRVLVIQSGSEMVTVESKTETGEVPGDITFAGQLSPQGDRYLDVRSRPGFLRVRASDTAVVLAETRVAPADAPSAQVDDRVSWSPEGDRVCLSVAQGDGTVALLVVDLTDQKVVRVNPRLSQGWSQVWSPDGTKLAFYAEGAIWMVGSDGKALRRVSDPRWFSAFPDWSPDGTKIAFQRETGADGLDLWIMDADGKNPLLLAGGPGFQGQPAWAP